MIRRDVKEGAEVQVCKVFVCVCILEVRLCLVGKGWNMGLILDA